MKLKCLLPVDIGRRFFFSLIVAPQVVFRFKASLRNMIF